MKTKSTLLATAMAAFIWLFANSPVLSQEILRNPAEMNLHGKTMNLHHKGQRHFSAIPGQANDDQSFMHKNVLGDNYHADTLLKYSITGGSEKVVNTYNEAGKILSTVVQIWMINKWVNYSITTNTYDADNNQQTQIIQMWQNTAWVNNAMVLYACDEAGNCLIKTRQNWDGTGWVNLEKSEYAYDANGNMLNELIQQWDGMEWMYSTNDSCSWDENGNRLTVLNQYWDGMAWMNNSLESCTYDANGKITNDLYQGWNGEAWENSGMADYTNDINGNRLTSLEKFWDSGDWLAYYKDTLSWDESSNYIGYTNWDCWDGETWEPYSHGSATYDASGNMLSFMHQNWNMGDWKNSDIVEYTYEDGVVTADAFTWAGSFWMPGDTYLSVFYKDNGNRILFWSGGPVVQVQVYFSSVTVGIDDPIAYNGEVAVYPNPATDQLTILPANQKSKIEKVQMFDPSGKEQQIALINNRIDLGKMQKGVYFIRITTLDGQTLVRKIVKQ